MDDKLKSSVWATAAALAILAASCSCSRPGVTPGSQESAQAEVQDAVLQPQTEEPVLAISEDGTVSPPAGAPAFHNRPGLDRLQDFPAGTLLTVRLREPVYATGSSLNNSFEAIVDQAVAVNGQTIIPKGAAVVGRVESAQTSKIKPNRGYVRLALHTVELGDRRIPVQTASLFAHEAPLGAHPIAAIHLEKGRRLTFRLIGDAENPTAVPPNMR